MLLEGLLSLGGSFGGASPEDGRSRKENVSSFFFCFLGGGDLLEKVFDICFARKRFVCFISLNVLPVLVESNTCCQTCGHNFGDQFSKS